MKTFFLLSDVNQGIVIAGIIAITTAAFGFIAKAILTPFFSKLFSKVDDIGSNINGLKTELVETTKALGEALGYQRGQKELKQEQKDDKKEAAATDTSQTEKNRQDIEKLKTPDPVPVVIKNPDPIPVVTKNSKNSDK